MIRTCPTCRTTVDAETALDGTGRRPNPGDVTVCAYCASVAVFTEDGLRLPTFDEMEELAEDDDIVAAVDLAFRFRAARRSRLN